MVNSETKSPANIKPIKPQKFVTLCGRIFINTDSQYFPHAQYRGRTIFLCTDSCLGAFQANPDLFYKMHRNSDKQKGL
jgi:YHS domain-containing protein